MRYVLLISSSFTFLFQKHAMFIRILEKGGGGWLVGWFLLLLFLRSVEKMILFLLGWSMAFFLSIQ